MTNQRIISTTNLPLAAVILSATTLLILSGHSLGQSSLNPIINPQACSYDPTTRRLTIKGENFQRGATVTLKAPAGPISLGSVKVKGATKIFVNDVSRADIGSGIDVTVINPDGSASLPAHLELGVSDDRSLSEDDVKTIIAQAVAQAEASGLKAT